MGQLQRSLDLPLILSQTKSPIITWRLVKYLHRLLAFRISRFPRRIATLKLECDRDIKVKEEGVPHHVREADECLWREGGEVVVQACATAHWQSTASVRRDVAGRCEGLHEAEGSDTSPAQDVCVWVRERKPKRSAEASQQADQYIQAQKQSTRSTIQQEGKQLSEQQATRGKCRETGHRAMDCGSMEPTSSH